MTSRRFLDIPKIWKVVLVVLCVGLFSYLVGFVVAINSDAFSEGKTFVVQSPAANRELGGNIEIQLAPLGYELEFAGSGGSATFDYIVTGPKATGKVQIALSKIGDIWRVEKATLLVSGRLVALM